MTLDDLATLIASRKDADPDTSWTAKLLAKGPEKCAEKFGEEAVLDESPLLDRDHIPNAPLVARRLNPGLICVKRLLRDSLVRQHTQSAVHTGDNVSVGWDVQTFE